MKINESGCRTLSVAAAVLLVSACSSTPSASPSTIPASGPITYTVEPFDFDGVTTHMTVTQDQFGGRMCPCVKVPYPADTMHNQQGADAIAKVPFKAGDTLMGFSLGSQVIALYLSQHTLPSGVNVLLAGWTLTHNAHMVAKGQGIPVGIANQVTIVANEYDGWSDSPDINSSAHYVDALLNSTKGRTRLHYYANADPDNPANVVVQQGNIKGVLIPTQHLPIGDDSKRAQINTAYSRPSSTPAQQAAATAEQVPQPNPAWAQNPEPVVQ